MKSLIGTCGLLLCAAAQAQYPGDAYFQTPSITAAAGAETRLAVAFFSGARPLGAVALEVRFDPANLRLVRAAPVGELGGAFHFTINGGVLRLVSSNTLSLVEPAGGVPVAELVFVPQGLPGQRIPLTSRVAGALDADGLSFASGQGYGAEIVIASPQSKVGMGALANDRRATALRPAGARVNLASPDGIPEQARVPPQAQGD